jgi:hypothetical protein
MASSARLLAVALALQFVGGCRDVTGLPLPVDAVRMDSIPDEYRTWWSQVEACSGRRRFFGWVRWYYVPNASYFTYRGIAYDGYWLSHPDRIVVAEALMNDAVLLRHEMLHAVLQDGDHPSEYFDRRCGTLVY